MDDDIDLAREDLAVLHAVVDADRAVSTSTIKEQLYCIDTGSQARYRFNNLEGCGLIETWHDDERTPEHQMAVRVAEPTEAGREIAEEFDEDTETLPLEERMLRLEKQVGRMRETYGKVKTRIVDLEDEVEDHDDDLEEVAEEIRNIKRVLVDETDSRISAGEDS
ncbi:hypothetical protein [Candidatus Halobonum tyrrellensis]|uniref:Uncharacterized protein n=1 Tax=Candidatus Halobonum tyrrellensis G22 TaxID=1324957 RepID=V4HE88_9EURY|nr:hypothetical protein [Candidatus Halobonum tyrrellensis]ESP88368.1 hypothetical protein K933_09602 [Candidatus Halobonum tyrrellensis G22]